MYACVVHSSSIASLPLQVLNMTELIKPRMAEEKEKAMQQVRDEATEAAVTTVKAKIKEQMDAEAEAAAAAKEAGQCRENVIGEDWWV